MQYRTIFLLALLLIGIGCGRKIASPRFEQNTSQSQSSFNEDRVRIYNATLKVKVKQADSAVANIKAIAKQYNGYIVKASQEYVTLRVEASQFKTAVKKIAALGKLQKKLITGKDVTDEYKDYQIRLENKLEARKKYLALLDKAENVEAALKVEKELERVNEEIDLLKGKIKRIEHLAKFSTISVNINQRKILGPLGLLGVGIYKFFKLLIVIKE